MLEELQPGDPVQVGPYRLTGVLGSGGMGRVYLGWSTGGRPVAIKVIKAELASDAAFRTRFRREVDAARTISGLYTALLVGADPDAPLPWLATAYIDAPSLAEAVAAYGPLPAKSVLALAAGLAEALDTIHAAGLVHRDLKPSNVLLAADGPRVIDFGLARAADSTTLTYTGQAMGSPGFLSPEQATGEETGPASDVFSLGAVLAFAASGTGPFGTGSLPALVYRVVHQSPALDGVAAELRPLIERCLAKEPGVRPSASDLLTELAGLHPGAQWLPERITAGLTGFAVPAPTTADAADGAPFAPTGTIPGPAGGAAPDAAAAPGDVPAPDAAPGPVPAPVAAPGAATATAGPQDPVPAAAATRGSRLPRPRRRLLMRVGAGAVVAAAAVTAFALTLGDPPSRTSGSGGFTPLAAPGPATSSPGGTPTPTPRPARTTNAAKPSRKASRPAVVTTKPSTAGYTPPPPAVPSSPSPPASSPRATPNRSTPTPSAPALLPFYNSGADKYACPGAGLRSGTSTTSAALKIINGTNYQLQVTWINPSGASVAWGTVAPKGTVIQQTDVDQVWAISWGGTCRGYFVVTSQSAQVIAVD